MYYTEKRKVSGFTIVELMIAVIVFGVLTAISYPVYKNYIDKSRVSEVGVLFAKDKIAVEEGYQASGEFSISDRDSSLETEIIKAREIDGNTVVYSLKDDIYFLSSNYV